MEKDRVQETILDQIKVMRNNFFYLKGEISLVKKINSARKRWTLLILSVAVAGTIASIYVKAFIGETKKFAGLYYVKWIIIIQLFIVIFALVYDRKKKDKIWYLKNSFIKKYSWLEWPVLIMAIVILMCLSVLLFYICQ